jgi:hypothetical protein
VSEIVQLKRQIELECQSMKQALDGFRITASHDIIQHQYDCLGAIQEQLAAIVGEQEAMMIVMDVYTQTIG